MGMSIKTLWPWIFLLMTSMTVLSELTVTKLSSKREEMNLMKNLLSVLEQHMRDQSVKMEIIGGELHAINENTLNDKNKQLHETILKLEVNQQFFKEKLSELEGERKEITSNITSITVENEIQNTTILQQEVKQQSLEGKLSDLEDKYRQCVNNITSIRLQNERRDATISQFEVEHRSIERKLNDLENKMVKSTSTLSKIEIKQNLQHSTLQRYETKLGILERKTDRGVAFTAQIVYGKPITDIKEHKKIIFGHIILNRGNAYDQNTGVFQCPKNGIYGFYYNLSTQKDKFALIELTKNGSGYYAIAYSSNEAHGSSFVLLTLVKGDKVWLRANKDCSTGEVLKHQSNTFSGFLLHAF